MRTEPQFVKPDDFKNRTGIDLNETLKGTSSNKANLFLLDVESKFLAWVDANTFRTTPWEELTEFQLENLQEAIIIQALYIYRNSDIALDSGYDLERGVIASQEELTIRSICPAALNYLKRSGLYNHAISNRRRYTRIRM